MWLYDAQFLQCICDQSELCAANTADLKGNYNVFQSLFFCSGIRRIATNVLQKSNLKGNLYWF